MDKKKLEKKSRQWLGSYSLGETQSEGKTFTTILRKEVIQPQVPLRLPCYDLTPVTDLTVVGCLLKG